MSKAKLVNFPNCGALFLDTYSTEKILVSPLYIFASFHKNVFKYLPKYTNFEIYQCHIAMSLSFVIVYEDELLCDGHQFYNE